MLLVVGARPLDFYYGRTVKAPFYLAHLFLSTL